MLHEIDKILYVHMNKALVNCTHTAALP